MENADFVSLGKVGVKKKEWCFFLCHTYDEPDNVSFCARSNYSIYTISIVKYVFILLFQSLRYLYRKNILSNHFFSPHPFYFVTTVHRTQQNNDIFNIIHSMKQLILMSLTFNSVGIKRYRINHQTIKQNLTNNKNNNSSLKR